MRRVEAGAEGRAYRWAARPYPHDMTHEEAVRNAHEWFEHNSGWAPPDADTLAELAADGVCRAPDECLVTPDGWCDHGLASWQLILDALDH